MCAGRRGGFEKESFFCVIVDVPRGVCDANITCIYGSVVSMVPWSHHIDPVIFLESEREEERFRSYKVDAVDPPVPGSRSDLLFFHDCRGRALERYVVFLAWGGRGEVCLQEGGRG